MKVSEDKINSLNQLNIESNRLSLKKFSEHEVEYNIQDEMNPNLMKYIRDVASIDVTRKKTEEVALPWSGKQSEWFMGALRLKSDNAYIGMVCLRYESVPDNIVEMGWRLSEAYHGKGFATEGAKLLVEYMINVLKVNKIIAYCDNENLASINIMNKLRMKREGLLKSHFRINNIWRDEAIFSLLTHC